MVIVLIILATSLVVQIVKIVSFHCNGPGFDPWSRYYDPTCHAVWPNRKTNKQIHENLKQTIIQNLRRQGINQTTSHVWENHKTHFSNLCTFPHFWFSDNARVLQELNET